MSVEISTTAIELSEQELDVVAGGGVSVDNINSLIDKSRSFFNQAHLAVAKTSFAGPGGSGSTLELAADHTRTGTSDTTIFK